MTNNYCYKNDLQEHFVTLPTFILSYPEYIYCRTWCRASQMFCVINDSGLVNLCKNKKNQTISQNSNKWLCFIPCGDAPSSINSWAASPLTAIDLLYLHYAERKERDVTFVSQFEVIAHFYWWLRSGNWLPFSLLPYANRALSNQ